MIDYMKSTNLCRTENQAFSQTWLKFIKTSEKRDYISNLTILNVGDDPQPSDL